MSVIAITITLCDEYVAQLHKTVYDDKVSEQDSEVISLAGLNKLEELHMKLMFNILRQLGRGSLIHESVRVLKTDK